MNIQEIKENTEYQRSLNHNYLIILNEQEEEDFDYQIPMLLDNRIKHILNTEVRMREGRKDFFYEISSMQPLSRIYEHNQMSGKDLEDILRGIIKAFASIRHFLLEESCLLLDPEYIYLDIETKTLQLVFYPFYESEIGESFQTLSEYILGVINHQDKEAVFVAYQFYKLVRKDYFVISDMEKLIYEKQMEETAEKGQEFEREQEEGSDKAWVEETEVEFIESEKEISKEKRDEQGILGLLLQIIDSWNPFKKLNDKEKKEDSVKKKEHIKESFMEREIEEENLITFIEDSNKKKSEEEYGKTVFFDVIEAENERMLVETKKGREINYPLAEFPITIGKIKDCVDLAFSDYSVSRIHAKIFLKGKEVYIKDCNSTNGTYVNGLLLNAEEEIPLEHQDEIRIGKVCLEYREKAKKNYSIG